MAPDDHDLKLSMILPAFDGAETLARHVPVLQQYLRHLGITWEIVVADDGSDDGGPRSRSRGGSAVSTSATR
jgi:glycosyltransferase involved in cell wall biosynthesis